MCFALAVAPRDGLPVVDDGGRDGHDIRAGEAGCKHGGQREAVHSRESRTRHTESHGLFVTRTLSLTSRCIRSYSLWVGSAELNVRPFLGTTAFIDPCNTRDDDDAFLYGETGAAVVTTSGKNSSDLNSRRLRIRVFPCCIFVPSIPSNF